MTITARYDGRCSACGGRISAGQAIEWDKATRETRHAKCGSTTTTSKPAAQPLASVSGGAQAPKGRNRKPGSCERCGGRLAPGAGILTYCEYDTGCPTHHDESGYHLWCADEAACKASKAEKATAVAAKTEAYIAECLASLRAIVDPIRITYHDGEYLSGYQVCAEPAGQLMDRLFLAPYVSGWGYHVQDALVTALGTAPTGAQVADYYAAGDAR